MNTVKKILLILLSILVFSNAYAEENKATIIDIEADNADMINVFLDKEVLSDSKNITWDIKINKDLPLDANIDLDNDRKVNISLKEDLETNKSYSFLSVLWVDGSMDFKLSDEINWVELVAKSSNKNIEKIIIVDSTHMEVYYRKSISTEDGEIWVKVLKEKEISSVELNLDNKKELNVKLKDTLEAESDYILMLFSLTLENENTYSFDEPIENFSTEKFSSNKVEEKQVEWEEKLDWEKVEKVALNAAETPDTWAATWVLILATFIMTNIVYFRKKIVK